MDTITSTEFRKRYASLEQPTVVTINGHRLGVWIPHGQQIELPEQNGYQVSVDQSYMAQAAAQGLLRSGPVPDRFGAPRPAPKPSR